MILSRKGILDQAAWEKAGIALPEFDIEQIESETKKAPEWVHFGGGNILGDLLHMRSKTFWTRDWPKRASSPWILLTLKS